MAEKMTPGGSGVLGAQSGAPTPADVAAAPCVGVSVVDLAPVVAEAPPAVPGRSLNDEKPGTSGSAPLRSSLRTASRAGSKAWSIVSGLGDIGLPSVQDSGILMVRVPTHAKRGDFLNIEVPHTGGQTLMAIVPDVAATELVLQIPYEVSSAGLVQHSYDIVDASNAVWPTTVRVIVAKVQQDLPFLNARCMLDVVAVLITVGLGAFLPILLFTLAVPAWLVIGKIAGALMPPAILVAYTYLKYRRSVLRRQMAISFVEVILWLLPWYGVVYALGMAGFYSWCSCRQKCNDDGCAEICPTQADCYLKDFIHAFIIAALAEETLKYLAIRRIVYASLVVDARSLFVYASCGALGFAAAENVIYAVDNDWTVVVMRAFTAVPLHMMTGLLMGCSMGRHRFYHGDVNVRGAFGLPVFAHGMYDIFLFTPKRWGVTARVVGFVLAVVTLVLAWLRARAETLKLEAVPQVDVRALIREGVVRPPPVLFWRCRWHRRGSVFHGELRYGEDGQAYTLQQFTDTHGEERGRTQWERAPRADPLSTPVVVPPRPETLWKAGTRAMDSE